ncbi:hypothetical protein DFR29_1171, partial [Tahibacter aquaticus]
MRTALFLCIGLALSLSTQAAEERCLVSFDAAQQDVCSSKVSVAHPSLEPLAKAEEFKNSTLRLVKFDGPIDEGRRAAIQSRGGHILGYAPEYAYIVRMPAGLDASMRMIRGVVWSGPFLPAFKVDVNIANELQFGN